MTETSPRLVISTKAQRSGEISRLAGTKNIGAGDLSTLSINSLRGFAIHTGMQLRSR